MHGATLEVSFGDVFLRAPETDEYLAVAAQILEMRRRELALAARPVTSAATDRPGTVSPVVTPPEGDVTPPAVSPAPAATPSVPATRSARRRPRWFRDQFPQVTTLDGEVRVLGSLEELRDLLRSRGLQPHPRGDASMLLWQVRNRLGFGVEPVPAP